MVRLLVRPDGSFIEVVYVSERPEDVAVANEELSRRFPDTVGEDYSNDAYEAMKPAGGTLSEWRRQGDRIVVVPQPPPPHPRQALIDEVKAATTIRQLAAAVEKLV